MHDFTANPHPIVLTSTSSSLILYLKKSFPSFTTLDSSYDVPSSAFNVRALLIQSCSVISSLGILAKYFPSFSKITPCLLAPSFNEVSSDVVEVVTASNVLVVPRCSSNLSSNA